MKRHPTCTETCSMLADLSSVDCENVTEGPDGEPFCVKQHTVDSFFAANPLLEYLERER